MSLVINNKAAMNGQPGVHIFISGVSLYKHLPGGESHSLAVADYGMKQLSSTALSAFKFYRWITDETVSLRLPIATCRVVLSPSNGEKDILPELAAANFDPCDRAHFAKEVRAWRDDAASHKDSIAIFYFAGHGIQNSKTNTVLLLDDFGDPAEGDLTNTASVGNIFDGMAPPQTVAGLKNIARTQFYFIDCCRVFPPQFKHFATINSPDVFKVELSGREDRHAPIFYAALPDTKAYALQNEQTFFTKALIECLNGAAGDIRRDEDGNDDDEPKWHVSAQTLNMALSNYFSEIANLPNTNQEFSMGGIPTGDKTIRWLDGPPEVRARIRIDPGLAVSNVKLEFIDSNGNLSSPAAESQDDIIRCRIKAGSYRVNARIAPPNGVYKDFEDSILRTVLPPVFNLKRKVL